MLPTYPPPVRLIELIFVKQKENSMSISIPFPHTLPRCFGNLSKSVASTYNCRYCFFLPHIVHVLLARLGFPLFFDPSPRKNKEQIGRNLEIFASLVLCFFTCFFLSFKILFHSCLRLRSPTLPATNLSIHHTFSTINIIIHPQASNSLLRN